MLREQGVTCKNQTPSKSDSMDTAPVPILLQQLVVSTYFLQCNSGKALSPVSCKILQQVRIWEMWGPSQHLELCKKCTRMVWRTWWHIILLKEAPIINEYCCYKGVYLVCNNVQVGGMCQSNMDMNGRQQGFPAEQYQGIKWLPPAWLLLIAHPGYYRFFSKVTCTQLFSCGERKPGPSSISP